MNSEKGHSALVACLVAPLTVLLFSLRGLWMPWITGRELEMGDTILGAIISGGCGIFGAIIAALITSNRARKAFEKKMNTWIGDNEVGLVTRTRDVRNDTVEIRRKTEAIPSIKDGVDALRDSVPANLKALATVAQQTENMLRQSYTYNRDGEEIVADVKRLALEVAEMRGKLIEASKRISYLENENRNLKSREKASRQKYNYGRDER